MPFFSFKKTKKVKRPSIRNASAPVKKNPRKEAKVTLVRPDLGLVAVTVFLTVFGVLMIYSASANIAFSKYGDAFYFAKNQIYRIIIGIFAAIILYFFPLKLLKKYSLHIFIISMFLLLYLVPESLFNIKIPLVRTLNGATRWIGTESFNIQPSELIKFAMILFISSWMTMSQTAKNNIEKWIKQYRDNEILHALLNFGYKWFPFFVIGLISVLILFERDLDTTMIIFFIFISVYIVGASSKVQSMAAAFVTALGTLIGLIATFGEDYRRARFLSFWQILIDGEPTKEFRLGESFQVWNGLVAIGTGGLFGRGYGESRQKLFFLQEASYTDSIFAVIAEEFGLLGTIMVIAAFLFFLSRGLNIAKNAADKFSSLVAVGLTSWIIIQAFLNIASNLAVIPFGGIPLPFLTYGGSNTIMIIGAVGLLLNISRHQKEKLNKFDRTSRLS